ncbi:hypothetical protein BCR42DRAFT_448276 [Absidia repens]|uniref:B30.2/SPRY domain-containing protein n=1 Tax=Absidia repens TaxID=90262 RepID=A0A1X2ISD1_9FUNG|nr:hypothetical protein BCR42DRAFT_448276 [Absidia repens]
MSHHAAIPEGFTRSIEQAWERTLAVAQNHVQAFDDQGRQPPPQPSDNQQQQDTQSNRTSSEFYDRERHMMHALDVLFGYAHEGPGYLAFIQTMTMILDSDSPVAMAFLSHIIERSALPSKQTMESISPAILSTMKQPGQHQPSTSPANFLHRLISNIGIKSKNAKLVEYTRLKLNATVIWSLLAEKYAGEMCMHMWSDQVGRLLIDMLVDSDEDLMVRLFALLALEKFSLTGTIKNNILETSDIQNVLQQVIDECEKANNGFYAMTRYLLDQADSDDILKLPPRRQRVNSKDNQLDALDQKLLAEKQQQHPTAVWGVLKHMICTSTGQITRRWKRQSALDKTRHKTLTPTPTLSNIATGSQPTTKLDPLTFVDNQTYYSPLPQQPNSKYDRQETQKRLGKKGGPVLVSHHSASTDASSTEKNQQKQPEHTLMNCFDTGFIPPQGSIRESWAKYLQLSFCARWALENVFNEGKQQIKSSPWNLSHIRTIMNPFDSTPHWKLGINGLELRNDRPHFESIRATSSVKTGKWYYETLLLSSGIMQLGWATSRCRFTPEEGYGVGDDCNGFAFDTYRTAVWADGTAVYPQIKLKVRCQSGDVLGSYLDLDNGLCSYFINGKDLGLTIEFENPTKQAAKANAEASKKQKMTTTPMETTNSPTSDSSSASAASSPSPILPVLDESNAADARHGKTNDFSDTPTDRPSPSNSSTPMEPSATPPSSSDAAFTKGKRHREPHRHYRHHHHYHNYRQIPSQDQSSSSTETFKTANSSSAQSPTVQTSPPEEKPSTSATTNATSTTCEKPTTAASATTPPPVPERGSAKGLGLYPAVSLTTHQHILINLGDRPWIYPPPISVRYRGISEAGRLDSDYRRRVLRWVNQRGYRIRKLHLAENHSPIRPHYNNSHHHHHHHHHHGACGASASASGSGERNVKRTNTNGCCYYAGGDGSSNDDYSSASPVSLTSTTSTDSLVEYDWDGPLCTICFSEPKNVILLPCQHGGIGQNCAKLLDMCHLCRSTIDDRVMTNDIEEDSTSIADGIQV